MNENSNQMSLLDAIGFSAPEPPKKQGKAKAEKPAPARQPSPDEVPASEEAKGSTDPESLASAEQAPAEKPAASRVEPSRAVENLLAPAPSATPAPTLAQPSNATDLHDADEAAVIDGQDADTDSLETPDTLPLDKYLCFALYSANHAMHGVYKALLKEIGLTYPQFLAMTVLWETNNVPVGTITSKLQLDTNTLTPLLKRLETMGLVTRTRNVKDERQVILKLTRKGRALQKKTEHFGQCIFDATSLEVEDAIELQQRIMKLRDNLRQAGLDA